jgi:voltage-gated potassium channel
MGPLDKARKAISMERLRARLHRQLDPDQREQGISPLNLLIVVLVVLSLLAMGLETEHTLPSELRAGLRAFNVSVLAIFALEYILRLWAAGEQEHFSGLGGRLRWMTRPFPMADLLAFGPELLVLLLIPPDQAGAYAAFKLFRFLRLVKLARFVPAFGVFSSVMRRSWPQLLIALAIAVGLIYVSAVLLYYIEGDVQEDFSSIPRAVWWAVATLTTVGYGDVYPITTLGKMVSGVIALAGVGVVALPTGILASAFADELRQREDRRRARHGARSDPRPGAL